MVRGVSAHLRGGPSIHSLVARRDALLAKHIVRFLLGLDSMWTSTMKAKYASVSSSTEWGIRIGQNYYAI